MTNLQTLKQQREKLDKQIVELEAKEKEQDLIYIPELKIKVEKNLHTGIDNTSKIVIPQGYRLLELSELVFIYNNYQDKFNWGEDKFFNEVTKQPIKDCEYPYWNAWLHGLSGVNQSDLNGYWGLYCHNAVRGCRFVEVDK